MSNIVFTPSGQTTVAAVNSTSVRNALPASVNQDKQLEIFNSTNGVAYAKIGDVTVVAALSDYAIPSLGTRRISLAGAETHIAIFLTAGATNGSVNVTRGEGF